jgi:hypothetical protein
MASAAKKQNERGKDSTEALAHLSKVTDAMHAKLGRRADALMGLYRKFARRSRAGGTNRCHRGLRAAAVAER